MGKIEIIGKPAFTYQDGGVKLELTPAELKAQLKPTKEFKHGDKLWVEVCFGRSCASQDVVTMKGHCFNGDEIIAHFPAEPEKVELREIQWTEDKKSQYIPPITELVENVNALVRAVKELQEKHKPPTGRGFADPSG